MRRLGVHRLGRELTAALARLGLPPLTWYQSTRHTFASQWVIDGGDMRELQQIMGHSSVAVTERYAHLRPGHFSEKTTQRIGVTLGKATAQVIPFASTARAARGQNVGNVPCETEAGTSLT
jgi:hypothetical protein